MEAKKTSQAQHGAFKRVKGIYCQEFCEWSLQRALRTPICRLSEVLLARPFRTGGAQKFGVVAIIACVVFHLSRRRGCEFCSGKASRFSQRPGFAQ